MANEAADDPSTPTAERARIATFGQLADGLRAGGDWYRWGPYLTERQWGTVREDYSPNGTAWDYFTHDDARSRAYRWGEEGLAGFSDIEQRLCVALSLWNGVDPILKERMFGLTGEQGNHGEDVKEYWWYTDALPSHAWNSWRYHYPQSPYPYSDLVDENARRGKHDAEYELLDTGVFDDDRYWVIEADWAKADTDDLLLRVRATNVGPDAATLHVLPTAWFRNTWSWDVGAPKPSMHLAADGTVAIDHPTLGALELLASDAPDHTRPTPLFCDNDTNAQRLFGAHGSAPYPKDAIDDHVVRGLDTVNPANSGTKMSFWYRLAAAPGETVEIRLRLRPADRADEPPSLLGADFDDVVARRRVEADEFYASLVTADCPADEAAVMRQAFAGMLWGKQLYAYDVTRWLDGDPAQPPPPPERLHGRNSRWRNFDAFDIMSMPDPWEYPWFAAWDLAFHCVTYAHIDPQFAKYQLLLLCREWFQHPDGALPAYEWAFDDVNPPLLAWAALKVYAIEGAHDVSFLERIFPKLLENFTWWVNREDADGSNLFEGGFLGLDNIGPLDRSHMPVDGLLEQSDATAWMAFFAIEMAAIASVLAGSGRPTLDLVLKFLEHFAEIREAMDSQAMWDETDGFFYDRFVAPDGTVTPIRVRSMVGIIPLLASIVLGERTMRQSERLGKEFAQLLRHRSFDPDALRASGVLRNDDGRRRLLLSAVDTDDIHRVLAYAFDPDEFLSERGIRSLSRFHLEHPYELRLDGIVATVDYEPAESTSGMFGGNSNWRGPVWFPLNYLLVDALDRLGWFFGDERQIEYPTGSGSMRSYTEVADDVRGRLVSLFLLDSDGHRPCYGSEGRFADDPRWRDGVLFFEYFDGDTGRGLGASHQTGWTGIVADLVIRRHGAPFPAIGKLLGTAAEEGHT